LLLLFQAKSIPAEQLEGKYYGFSLSCHFWDAATFCWYYIFTALHEMPARTSYEKGVCLSVCPSVCQTRDLWQNERNVCQYSYTTWKIIHPSFVTRRMVGGGDPFDLKLLVKLTPLERKTPSYNRYLLVAPRP